jgi:hypothetical protein
LPDWLSFACQQKEVVVDEEAPPGLWMREVNVLFDDGPAWCDLDASIFVSGAET